MLTDTHCHLGRYPRRDGLIADLAGRVGVVVATSTPSEARDLLALFGADPDVLVGIGLHPELAGSVYLDNEFEVLAEIVQTTGWISEVGLDATIADAVGPAFGNGPTLAAQHELLERVLHAAGPAVGYSVHSRGAERETLRVLARAGARRVILHGFAGDRAALFAAVDQGCYLSVGPAALTTAQSRERVSAIPVDRVLLETDGPYSRWSGRPARPDDCNEICQALADVLGRPGDVVQRSIEANFHQLRSGHPAWEMSGTENA